MSYRMSVKVLKDFFLKSTNAQIGMVIEDIHPADILDAIREYPMNKLDVLNKLPDWMIANIIDEAEDEEKYELLNLFESFKQANIVEEMSSDELADMLGTLESTEVNEILEKLDKEDAEDVRELMSYAPDTAGALMANEFLSIQDSWTVNETLNFLRTEATDAETTYYMYVLDNGNHLKGVLTLKDLVLTYSDKYISEIMNKNLTTVSVSMSQNDVADIFIKYGYISVPVVDRDDEMLGIITIDDVIYVIEKRSAVALEQMANLNRAEKSTDTYLEAIKRRLPVNILKFSSAIICILIIMFFNKNIHTTDFISLFIPVILIMNTNVGAKALTLIVRSIVAGEITFKKSLKLIYKEFAVGITTSIISGILVALLAFIITKTVLFSVAVGLSVILSLVISVLSSYFIPLIFQRFKLDTIVFSTLAINIISYILGLSTYYAILYKLFK